MKYDVAVVGAGPSGSTAAKFLSEKGFKIILIDKDKFPRDKPCGGGLPFRALKKFKYVNDERIIESYSYGGFVHSPSLKYTVELQTSEPIVAMTLRKKFDFELAKLAVDNGADFCDGVAVTDLDISKDGAKVFLDNGKVVESEIIVGADGVWSIVAKKTGLKQYGLKTGICVLQEYQVGEKILDKFFGKNRLCHIHARFQNIVGYGWVFPKKEHLNIGIGEILLGKNISDVNRNLLNVYKEYIKNLQKNKIIPDKLERRKYRGGAVPVQPLEKTYAERVVLIGDAGGFINPLSGEGIYYAMTTGKIAGEVITEALETEETNEQFLSKYQTSWKKDIGKDIDFLIRLAKRQKEKPSDKLFRIANRDKVLGELILGVVAGNLNLQENKRKLIRRYIYGAIKDFFSSK